MDGSLFLVPSCFCFEKHQERGKAEFIKQKQFAGKTKMVFSVFKTCPQEQFSKPGTNRP